MTNWYYNPTKSRENSLTSYLRNLKRDGIVEEATYSKILPCGSTAGVLYGLPKVHKIGCPFRPIVLSVNTYNYNLASFLVNVLKPISTNQFTIKDSFTFVDWVKAHQHNNEILTIEINLTKLYSLPDPPVLPRQATACTQRLAFVCNEEKPLRFWWWLLRSNRWRHYGVSTRSSFREHFHV